MSLTEQEAVTAALVANGRLTVTANTAHAPRDPGEPNFLYAAVAPPSGDPIVASGLVEYVEVRVELTLSGEDLVAATALVLDPGTIILDAKVLVTIAFDAGTTNELAFSTGSRVIVDPPKATFAKVLDLSEVSPSGGVAVTGFTSAEADRDQFAPVAPSDMEAVFVDYAWTGDDPTQGAARVLFTIIRPTT